MRTGILLMTTGLLLLSILSVDGCRSPVAEPENREAVNAIVGQVKPDSVELVYFHTKVACHCMSVVEDNIRYAVDNYFASEVANGKVILTNIISDDPANAVIVKRYDAMLFTLFITEKRGNKAKTYPVSDIWNMTGDDNRDKLINFIKMTVTDVLEGKST